MKDFDFNVSDPLVRKLKKGRRKKALMAKVARVNNTEKKVNNLLGDIF